MDEQTLTPEPPLAGSLADYRASREAKPGAPAPETKKAETPASGDELEESAAAPGTAEQLTEQADTPGPEQEPARKKGGFQRTIERLNRENAELKQKLAGQPPAGESEEQEPAPAEEAAPALPQFSKPKPTLEQFESLEAFTEAITDWKLEKRDFDSQQASAQSAARAEADQLTSDWNTRKEATKSRHADYDDVIAAVDSVKLHPVQQRAIMESELGPELAYALASDPEELQRIVRLPPLAFARELGKLEAKLASELPGEPAPEPEAKVSSAPRPIRPVRSAQGAAAGVVDVKNISLGDYRRARESGKLR
jgi:hypothetical protein